MIKTHKYRLYPNKTQERELMYWMRMVCDAYCLLVDYKSRVWQASGKYADQKDLREIYYSTRDAEPSFSDLTQAIISNMLIRNRIMAAYESFFALMKRYKENPDSLTGMPRVIDIKSHNNWAILKKSRYESGDTEYAKDLPRGIFSSIEFGADKNHKNAWIKGDRLYLGTEKKFKSGGIKIRVHRPVDGDLRTITVKREYGKWYACCSIRCDPPPIKIPSKNDIPYERRRNL